MNLVLDARFWRRETGGISRYSRELLAGLLALGTDDTFQVVLTPADAAEFAVVDPRVTARVVPIGHYSLAEQLKLPGVLRSLQPDLVHFLNFNQPLLYAGPRVTTIHDLTVKKFPEGRSQTSWIRHQAFQFTMRQAARSDAVIAISEATKRDILAEYPVNPTQVHVVYEGADARFHPYDDRVLATFRTRLGLTKPYILFVSQWRPHKGLPELVSAFAAFKAATNLPHVLVVTGKPSSDFPEILNAIDQSPVRADIITPGFVDDADMPHLYAAADCFVLPSHYEGFGLPVLEALQSGTPVICTDVGSLPEVGGDAPVYVPVGQPAVLGDALTRVLGSERQRVEMSAAGRAQAAKFSWQQAAEATHSIYQTLTVAR